MQKLDPKAVWLFFVGFVLRWFFVVIFLSIWISASFGVFDKTAEINRESLFGLLGWLWITIPVFLVLCFIWAQLTYRFYRYELREDGFRKEFGVIWKKYVTIPYGRIQNVDIYRGVLVRILGLSDLNVQTAGASAVVGGWVASGIGAEGRLPALSRDVAEKLRDELIKRARQSTATNQGL